MTSTSQEGSTPGWQELVRSGYRLACTRQLLRMQFLFFLAAFLMLSILFLLVAGSALSLFAHILSTPLNQLAAGFLRLGAGAIIAFGLVILFLWLAQQWLEAYFIAVGLKIEGSNASAEVLSSSRQTASQRYWPVVFAALISLSIGFLAGNLFSSLANRLPQPLGLFAASIFSLLITLALLFLPYRVVSGSSPLQALLESVFLFRFKTWAVLRAYAIARLGSVLILAASALPVFLVAVLLLGSFAGGKGSAGVFLFLLLMLIPAVLILIAGASFAMLYSIGVLSASHQALGAEATTRLPRARQSRGARRHKE